MRFYCCLEVPSLRSALLLAVLLLAGVGIGGGIALSGAGNGRGTSPAPSAPGAAASANAHSAAREGWTFHRKLPPLVLTDAAGHAFALRSLRGKVVVLAPSLTLCHEICPMTTQALMLLRRALAARGLAPRVALVEVTVDPWRDSPARLRAYARLTGSRLIQLTGSVARIRRLWNFLGIGFRRVPQGNPPDTDWWTGRPETFDVDHTDGVFLIDSRGYERRFFGGMAGVGGRISPALRRLLSRDGLNNLAHSAGGWTASELLRSVEMLLA